MAAPKRSTPTDPTAPDAVASAPNDVSALVQRDNSGPGRSIQPSEGASNFASTTREILASFAPEG